MKPIAKLILKKGFEPKLVNSLIFIINERFKRYKRKEIL